MECKICKNKSFKVENKWELKNGYYKRSRICNKCGHKIITIELPEEEFNKYIRLVKNLKKIIGNFIKK
jgi:transcriptional regulator NrdR family protein